MENTTENLEDRILSALSQVIDPELRCDIVNLGLVYGLTMASDGNLPVKLTLTTMGCPLTAVLEKMIINALMPLEEINQVCVELVWEPAWSVNNMSRYAKMALGIHA